MLLHSGGFALAILDSVIRVSSIEKTNHDVLIVSCDCGLTVVHMLFECPRYSIVRQRYFSVTNLKDLFETVNTHTILDFIKEIGFYSRI